MSRPYECPVCGDEWHSKKDMLKHIKRHHPKLEDYEREDLVAQGVLKL